MALSFRKPDGSTYRTQSALIRMNTEWLHQALELLESIDDHLYVTAPRRAPNRVGSHLRHIIEFYTCFLDGIETLHIDYDSRPREKEVERNRTTAAARIRSIIERLETEPGLRGDSIVFVRTENAEALNLEAPFLMSSIGRELLTLSSHTVHHFALIATALKLLGYEPPAAFGVAPSTLRHWAKEQEKSQREELVQCAQ